MQKSCAHRGGINSRVGRLRVKSNPFKRIRLACPFLDCRPRERERFD